MVRKRSDETLRNVHPERSTAASCYTAHMSFNEFVELVKQGGVTMAIILAASVGALVIGFERAIFLRGFSARASELHEAVMRPLLRGDGALALNEANRSQVTVASIYRAALDRVTRPERIADGIDRARREVVQAMRGPLWILATMGAVLPFVGLFGTVWGILKSFRSMATAGGGGFAVVASGISEALITTAAGIAVAVEAVVIFNFFTAMISRAAFTLGLRCDELSETVQEMAPSLRGLAGPTSSPGLPQNPAPAATHTTPAKV
jgi:biopolymer transport protein ExbB/TolQ